MTAKAISGRRARVRRTTPGGSAAIVVCHPRRIRRLPALLLPLALLGLPACGSLDENRTPRAAEPARSPALTEPPAGRVVEIGNRPEGVAVDPGSGLVFVATREPDRIEARDSRTGRLLNRADLPGPPRHMTITEPAIGAVVIPMEPVNLVGLLPLQGTALKTLRTGAQPHDATVAAGQIFVGDERADAVTVLDDEAKRLGGFKVARQPGGLAPAAGGSMVAVVSVRDRVIELFEATAPYRRLARENAGVGPTHVVSDGEDHLYVTDTAGDALLVFRVSGDDLELERRVALRSSPYGIAIDTERERIWVTLTGTNRVVKLWTNGPRTVADVASVRQPDTIAVDEATGRAYVTGKVEGVLQLLDPADRRPRARTP